MSAATAAPRSHNPWRIPRPAVISFSGGRTSAYMLKHIVDAYGGRLPDDVAVVFANTGMERARTLDFVDTCATAWGVPIVWVEYDWDSPHRTRLVDHRTASRNGDPFAALIERKAFVPNATLRHCIAFLKRDRIDAYARYQLGLRHWHAVVGLRADELRRAHRRPPGPAARRRPHRRARRAGLVKSAALRPRTAPPRRQLRLLLPPEPRQAAPHHPRRSRAPTGGSNRGQGSPTVPAPAGGTARA